MSETGIIYAFFDQDNVIRYIGQTIESLQKRIRGHLRDSERPVTKFHRWLAGQVASGHLPRVAILERPSVKDLYDRERTLIVENSDTLYNSTHVLTREEQAEESEEREAVLAAARERARLESHPCRKDACFADSDWDAVADTKVYAEWVALERQFHHLGDRILNDRKGITETHASLARLAALCQFDKADRVLVAAILTDWEEGLKHRVCEGSFGERDGEWPHLSRHTFSGIRRAARTARSLAGSDLPRWHWKVMLRTDATDPLGVYGVDGHLVLGPSGLQVAVASATRGYAAKVLRDIFPSRSTYDAGVFLSDEELAAVSPLLSRRRQEIASAEMSRVRIGMGAT